MKLYQLPFSHYSAKVRIVAQEKGIALELPPLPGGSCRSPEFRAINPLGRVPTLVHGDLVLPESEVIVEYLEELRPEPSMLPRSPRDRAESRFLSRYHDLYLAPHLSKLYAGTSSGMPGTEAGAQAVNELHEILAGLEGRVAPSPWLLGDQFNLCDASYPLSMWYAAGLSHQYGRPVTADSFPRLMGWFERASTRPSVAETIAEAKRALGL